MIDDDFDSQQLFEGRVEISRTENGASFGLDEESYFRMARCAMDAAGMGIEPSVICRLSDDERGCKLVLFGRTHQFSIRVRVSRSGATIALVAEPLDGPLHCQIPLYESEGDNDVHWSRALRAMCAVESIAYYDSRTGRLSRVTVMASKRRKLIPLSLLSQAARQKCALLGSCGADKATRRSSQIARLRSPPLSARELSAP